MAVIQQPGQEIEITMPDGRVVVFPAGTPQDTIQRVVREGYRPENPEAALARYQAANPQDIGATVVQHGEAGYPGSYSRFDEASQTYVADTEQERRARDFARAEMSEDGASSAFSGGIRALSRGLSYGLSDRLEAELVAAQQRGRNFSAQLLGQEIPFTSGQLRDAYRRELDRANADFRQENGALDLGLSIAGGIVAPGAIAAGRYVASAPGWASAGGRGLATGAPVGAVAGAATAPEGQEFSGAVRGGVTGGTIGFGVPVAARGIGGMVNTAGGTRVSDMLQDGMERIMGRPMTGQDRAVREVFRGVSPNQFEERIANARAYGIEPVPADAGGSVAQSRIRVAATRQTPGREIAEDFATSRRMDSQDFVAGLGERISPISASPAEIDEVLQRYQQAASRPAFDAARAGPPIRLDNNTAQALWSPQGRRGVASAASLYQSSTDPAERAVALELSELARRMAGRSQETALGSATDEGLELSVTAADLLRRHLSTVGDPGTNTRRIVGGLGQAIGAQTRQQSPAYDAAMEGFASRARLGDATEIGERFVGNRGTARDFVRGIQGMMTRSPRGDGQSVVPIGTGVNRAASEIDVARAAARSGVENAGNTPAGAAGVLDAFATGRGQFQRSEALMGRAGAEDLRQGGRVGRAALETGRNVNPRAGSNTFLNQQDGNEINQVGSVIGNLARGNPLAAVGGLFDLFRSAGISDDMAEQMVRVGLQSGPDEVLAILRTRMGEPEARRIVSQMTPILAAQSGMNQPPVQQPRMVGPLP
jgi:hypothetical protein